MKKHLLLSIFFFLTFNLLQAQCASDVCNSNVGLSSYNDASTIAYDNMGSSFHSTFIKEPGGTYRVWGENMANSGTTNLLNPISFDQANYPALTGTVYYLAIGSNSIFDVQLFALTSTGLFVLGDEGVVIDGSITTSPAFQKITVNGQANGLPVGVNPSNVKMLFATTGTLMLTTCNGSVYVLSLNSLMRGNGNTGTTTAWAQVMENASTPLSNVIVARGNANIGFALKSDGTLWTWGKNALLGNNSAASNQSFATQMTLPVGITGVKMIQATTEFGLNALSSYYVLGTNKRLYSLGLNNRGQLGDNSTVTRTTWVNALNPTNVIVNDGVWISANEHDVNNPNIALIKTGGLLYTAGNNSRFMVGRAVDAGTNFFNVPNGVTASNVINFAEVGGHTCALIKEGSIRYGYVGHFVNGSVGNGSSLDSQVNSFDFITPPIIAVCGTQCTIPKITNNSPICDGDSAIFNITGNPGDILTYNINGGTPNTVTLSATGVGTVTVATSIGYQTLYLTQNTSSLPGCTRKLELDSQVTTLADTPTFDQIPPICPGGSFVLPLTSNEGYFGTWSPANNNLATTTYTFTPAPGQCATNVSMTVTVGITPTFTQVDTICSGTVLAPLPTTSNNGISGTWSPALNNLATTTYTFTPSTANTCTGTVQMTIGVINSGLTPTFTQVATICSGQVLAPLPTTSTNGIVGTWSPALNNTTTTTYTFTPTANTCAGSVQMTIGVVNGGTPTFTQVATICAGTVLSALPTTSNNGIIGTWSPALNNLATTTYTFTPTTGLCATTQTMTIGVIPITTPTFTQVATICAGATLSALPTTSTNGIVGTWSPALNNLATTTYTFVPTASSCTTNATMTIGVIPITTPTFTQVATICAGGTLSPLPTTSTNGIVGSWSPALNNLATTTYTFTPSAGQCAVSVSMTIGVTPNITPTFTQVATICAGTVLSALPTSSIEGITGTWSPALNNLATTTYTFTPTTGLCATTQTMTIGVIPITTPTFTQVATICAGATLSPLPTTSTNGIVGIWSPALNNLATTTYTFVPTASSCTTNATMTIGVIPITTPTFTQVVTICAGGTLSPLPTTSTNGIVGSWTPALNNLATTIYSFTPSAGQCAVSVSMTIGVTPNVTPTFTQVATICAGTVLSALPTSSIEGITGTWSPALNNLATTTYTFTPTTGLCATTQTMTIGVIPITIPTFTQVATICAGATLSPLPTTSTNGIVGTWTPALNNLATTTYTFVPTASSCTTNATMTIGVIPITTPTFTQVATICAGGTLSPLPTTSTNGIVGSWSPALNNLATTTYTFTPSAGQCAVSVSMTIGVTPNVTPTFTQVATICAGTVLSSLPTSSIEGITGTWSPALNNLATTTYTFTPTTGLCATTKTMTIGVIPITIPTFTQVATICAGETLSPLPTTSTNGIVGTWSPALNNLATTTYTFVPTASSCTTNATMTIGVIPITTPTFTQVATICAGGTLSPLPTTSTNGIVGSWSPALNNLATTTYTFTPSAGQCAVSVSMTIGVTPNVTPTFAQVATICAGTVLSALPTSSIEGITGTWSPALNNLATTTYTFTPTTGLCATTQTMTIGVIPITTPTFTQVATICAGATLSPLPTTSTNGIVGTWSPALNNLATTTYTFVPTASSCTTNATMTIGVIPITTPTFTQVATICAGGTLSPLPTTSTNGIVGSWTPTLNNLATTTYTFTPSAGQCAVSVSMTIGVTPNVTPTFAQVATICAGTVLSALPTTSIEGITGTWSPALNNLATTTYTFTPTTGLCATTQTMTIGVIPITTPTFTQVATICAGETLSPLPTTSTNGIVGTWTPALNNLATTTYTFVPTASSCTTNATMTIGVIPITTPTFTQVATICAGGTLSPLPTTSTNGIVGSWAPALNSLTTTTYTFTPSAGQCAVSVSMTIGVTPNVTPTFTQVATICAGTVLSALPTNSIEGITGTWLPALNNLATTTYTFTPTTGLCATTQTMTIGVIPITTPTFTQVATICAGATLSPLPTTSTNGIVGTWTPALNNLATTTYTFVPTASSCTTNATMTIGVIPITTPTFTQVATICAGGTLSPLPTTSTNGIVGSWSPALNNLATTTYTFTPSAGQCAVSVSMTIGVTPNVTPTFTQVATICAGTVLSALPTSSIEGITGTWSPALNNLATTTYTFTPTTGLCATTQTMTIGVIPITTPTFTQVATICAGATLSPLPTTSTNGIVGTWSPALNNLATTTYTFVPTASSCTTNATMTIGVIPITTPTFTQVATICAGGTLSPLPTTSTNGIVGSWSPALNNLATTTYTFTPSAGQCAVSVSMTIGVTPNVTPTFTQVATICAGTVLSALPTSSIEGITGTWLPALNNLATTTYTFTPTAGLCATKQTMTIGVIPNPIVKLNNGSICYNKETGVLINGYTLSSGVSASLYNFKWYFNNTLLPNTTSSILVQQIGNYYVEVTNKLTNCTFKSNVATIIRRDISFIFSFTQSDYFSDETFINVISSNINNGIKYQLDYGPAQESNQFFNVSYGFHTIRIFDEEGCLDKTETICVVGYMKFFTPNNDGYNDVWNILGTTCLKYKTVYIFNRYGKLLTVLNNNQGWDGLYNGTEMFSDDYWFKIDYIDEDGLQKEFKSHFSLKR